MTKKGHQKFWRMKIDKFVGKSNIMMTFFLVISLFHVLNALFSVGRAKSVADIDTGG